MVDIVPCATPGDRQWLAALWERAWGGEPVISGGRAHFLADLAGLIAWADGVRVGAATYALAPPACELVSLNATPARSGIGSALLAHVERAAEDASAARIWLVTTNDNLDALRFYQRRGYRIAAVHVGAVDRARRDKPRIPPCGHHGIALHDEIELVKALVAAG